MRITESQLRRYIRQELSHLTESQTSAPMMRMAPDRGVGKLMVDQGVELGWFNATDVIGTGIAGEYVVFELQDGEVLEKHRSEFPLF